VYSILSAQLAARAQEANIGLISSSAPIATTKMVDEVFRNYNPNNDGLVFGKGLSPFGIMCEGHEGIHTSLQKVEQHIMLGEGVSVSLADHNAVLSYEVLFPTRPFVAKRSLAGGLCWLMSSMAPTIPSLSLSTRPSKAWLPCCLAWSP
jgi:hypothetical protein